MIVKFKLEYSLTAPRHNFLVQDFPNCFYQSDYYKECTRTARSSKCIPNKTPVGNFLE